MRVQILLLLRFLTRASLRLINTLITKKQFMASGDNYNRKDYSAAWFVALLIVAAAYIMLRDLGVF